MEVESRWVVKGMYPGNGSQRLSTASGKKQYSLSFNVAMLDPVEYTDRGVNTA
jgi:hypothetical protein